MDLRGSVAVEIPIFLLISIWFLPPMTGHRAIFTDRWPIFNPPVAAVLLLNASLKQSLQSLAGGASECTYIRTRHRFGAAPLVWDVTDKECHFHDHSRTLASRIETGGRTIADVVQITLAHLAVA